MGYGRAETPPVPSQGNGKVKEQHAEQPSGLVKTSGAGFFSLSYRAKSGFGKRKSHEATTWSGGGDTFATQGVSLPWTVPPSCLQGLSAIAAAGQHVKLP